MADIKQRKCPHCNKVALKKGDKVDSMLKAFGSVHTDCKSCNKPIVLGYVQNQYVVITNEKFEELTAQK